MGSSERKPVASQSWDLVIRVINKVTIVTFDYELQLRYLSPCLLSPMILQVGFRVESLTGRFLKGAL